MRCEFEITDDPQLHVCRVCRRPLRAKSPPERCNRRCRGVDFGDLDGGDLPASCLEFPACVHRGELLRRAECVVCGLRGQQMPIAACSLFGQCAAGRYKYGVQETPCRYCPSRLPENPASQP